MRLWHGGVPGLRAGDALLAPDLSGAPSLARFAGQLGGDPGFCRTDRVYATTDRQVARGYAGMFPDGGLYEVELLGELEADPDCRVPGLSWMAPAGRVLRVVDPVVLFRSETMERWERMVDGRRR